MITLTVILQNNENTSIEKAISLVNDRKYCAENALFTVDGISFFPSYDVCNRPFVFAVNNSRPSNKIIYRLDDNRIIESSMSTYSSDKFEKGLRKNRDRLVKTAQEVLAHA